MTYLNQDASVQINQCIDVLKNIFGQHLLGAYLYGSAIVGGLKKYSDIDLLIVTQRLSTDEEKQKIINELLKISGIYMAGGKRPIELTIVVKSEINPWNYPPSFDFQYGEWLRNKFENGIINPWPNKFMPDLAIIITQVLLASETLYGVSPPQSFESVPSHDFIFAIKDSLQHLQLDLFNDTRNVLLTYSRIWATLETSMIYSKSSAAMLIMNRLPEEYQCVLQRAISICNGEANEYWDDIALLVQSCADFMVAQINKKLNKVSHLDFTLSVYEG